MQSLNTAPKAPQIGTGVGTDATARRYSQPQPERFALLLCTAECAARRFFKPAVSILRQAAASVMRFLRWSSGPLFDALLLLSVVNVCVLLLVTR
jgi:hypothetical protein